MSDLLPVSLPEMIECVERELRLRTSVYPRRIAAGKMTPRLAERETGRMRAVLDTLRRMEGG